MIIGAFFVGITLSFLIAFSLHLHATNEGNFGEGFVCGMFVIILLIAEIIMLFCISNENEAKPKAIDVYRNKTELEITSVNGVPRDTVVVWKGNKQK